LPRDNTASTKKKKKKKMKKKKMEKLEKLEKLENGVLAKLAHGHARIHHARTISCHCWPVVGVGVVDPAWRKGGFGLYVSALQRNCR
jgi:hypothetical protein